MRRLAVFASGNGTNFEAIARACRQGVLAAEVVLLVCDRPGARVIGRAEEFGIPTFVFAPKAYGSKEEYERQIVQRLEEAGAELVCLAGYMRILGATMLGACGGRIVNIHPSLLPAFRGKDAIGQAFDYGVKVFGVPIHWVDAHNCADAEVRLYDNLFADADPEGDGKDYLACLNPDSLSVLTGCKVERMLAGAEAPAAFQFLRLGYFAVDNKDSAPEHLVFNRAVALKDSFKKA